MQQTKNYSTNFFSFFMTKIYCIPTGGRSDVIYLSAINGDILCTTLALEYKRESMRQVDVSTVRLI